MFGLARMHCIDMAFGSNMWRAVVNAVMYFLVP